MVWKCEDRLFAWAHRFRYRPEQVQQGYNRLLAKDFLARTVLTRSLLISKLTDLVKLKLYTPHGKAGQTTAATTPSGAGGRGKSGLHRAGCWLTARRSNLYVAKHRGQGEE